MAIKLGNCDIEEMQGEPEALDCVNKFYLIQALGSALTWQSIDSMPYLDYQMLILCMNAYNAQIARIKQANTFYSREGLQR